LSFIVREEKAAGSWLKNSKDYFLRKSAIAIAFGMGDRIQLTIKLMFKNDQCHLGMNKF